MNQLPRAWVLNLDAEHELEAGRRYQPTERLRALVRAQRSKAAESLLGPHDILVTEEALASANDRPLAEGYSGYAWSPTPRALALLGRAGAMYGEAPDVGVLQRVNARAFTVGVRAPLIESSFAKTVANDIDQALAQIAKPAPLGWLVRRPFGAAGRGRKRIYAGRPDEAERAWLAASLRRGSLVIEPFVEVTTEFTRSGLVRGDGSVFVAPPCFQQVTREGAWTSTRASDPDAIRREHDQRLGEAAEAAGRALAAEGYFGPFGIDAYLHRSPNGATGEVLNPLSEINARYTMDWTVGQR